AHAAVNESVELTAEYSGVGPGSRAKIKSFINGILRALARLLTDERTTVPAADAVPLEEGEYRRLTKPAFPDPAAAPLPYFPAAFAFPAWLAQHWFDRYPWDECVRLGFWFA